MFIKNTMLFMIVAIGVIFSNTILPLYADSYNEANFSIKSEQAQNENLIWFSGFEEGAFQFANPGQYRGQDTGPRWLQAQIQNNEYSFQFVNQPARCGSKALRLEWRRDGLQKGNDSKKAFIHFGGASTPEECDRWYGFSYYLPSKDFVQTATDANFAIVFQLHAVPDFFLKEPYRQPLLDLSFRNAEFVCSYSYDLDKISPANKNIQTNRKFKPIDSLLNMHDKWTDVVLHVKLSLENEGVVQVWVNGKQVLDDHAVNIGYNDAVGPYPGWGIYAYGGPEHFVEYLDEIRVGDKNANYSMVAPGRTDGTSKPQVKISK